MGLVRYTRVEEYSETVDTETGEVLSTLASDVWTNTAVASAIAIFLVNTGSHEIGAIRRAVHIIKDFGGAKSVRTAFKIDA
jgi:hypothetical protein